MIALRLEQNRPHKEAIRRGLAVLALPRNVRAAATCTARTVDAIWHAAGDRSADFSWYTKRAILAAIYSATLLYWLRDTSEDDAATLGVPRPPSGGDRAHRPAARRAEVRCSIGCRGRRACEWVTRADGHSICAPRPAGASSLGP